jgi:ATP phosphoribosyltransferase
VILEAEMESFVTETLRLGFGKCALQVQVPEAGPVQSAEALAGKRVVTSFEVLAGRFFAGIDDRAGLVADARTLIEYVGGSVEAACALGLADGIGACVFLRLPLKVSIFQTLIETFLS